MTPQRKPLEDVRALVRQLSAFTDTEVQSQLQLTDDQQEQIRAFLKAGFQEAKPIRESLAEVQKRTLGKATSVLTEEQKSQWEQMQGQQFEVGQEGDRPLSQGTGVRGRAGMRRKRKGGPEMGGGPGIDDSE